MAPWPNGRHRPAVGQRYRIASLQAAQEVAHFNSSLAPEWRRLYIAVKPNQRLVFRANWVHDMSDPTYSQSVPAILTLRCSKQRLLSRRSQSQPARQGRDVADRNR
jgi:uncharacterized protein YndB with AHSA1/START domain